MKLCNTNEMAYSDVTHKQHSGSYFPKSSDPNFLSIFYSHSRLHHLTTWKAKHKAFVKRLQESGDRSFPGLQELKRTIAMSRAEEEYGEDWVKGQEGEGQRSSGNMIMHIDMDCFFASASLINYPELRGKPVAVAHYAWKMDDPSNGKLQSVREQKDRQIWAEDESSDLNKGDKRPKQLNGPPNWENHSSEQCKKWPQPIFPLPTARLVQASGKDNFMSLAEIASCSYEARQAGVRNGMIMKDAKELCPELQTIPYDFDGYYRVSKVLYETVARYTHDIEACSCDELLVDITKVLEYTGATPLEFSQVLRDEIFAKTECTASAGLAPTAVLARLCTRVAKPNGSYQLQPGKENELLSSVSVRELPGVGGSINKKLLSLGITTCADLQQLTLDALQKQFGGKTGHILYQHCRGEDDRPIRMEKERKYVSVEVNYGIRFNVEADVVDFMFRLSAELHKRLQDLEMAGRTLTVKLKVRRAGTPKEDTKFMGYGVFDNKIRSATLPQETDDLGTIRREYRNILLQMKVAPEDIRGVGVQISRLKKAAITSKRSKSLDNMLVARTDSDERSPPKRSREIWPSDRSPKKAKANSLFNYVIPKKRVSDDGSSANSRISKSDVENWSYRRSDHKNATTMTTVRSSCDTKHGDVPNISDRQLVEPLLSSEEVLEELGKSESFKPTYQGEMLQLTRKYDVSTFDANLQDHPKTYGEHLKASKLSDKDSLLEKHRPEACHTHYQRSNRDPRLKAFRHSVAKIQSTPEICHGQIGEATMPAEQEEIDNLVTDRLNSQDREVKQMEFAGTLDSEDQDTPEAFCEQDLEETSLSCKLILGGEDSSETNTPNYEEGNNLSETNPKRDSDSSVKILESSLGWLEETMLSSYDQERNESENYQPDCQDMSMSSSLTNTGSISDSKTQDTVDSCHGQIEDTFLPAGDSLEGSEINETDLSSTEINSHEAKADEKPLQEMDGTSPEEFVLAVGSDEGEHLDSDLFETDQPSPMVAITPLQETYAPKPSKKTSDPKKLTKKSIGKLSKEKKEVSRKPKGAQKITKQSFDKPAKKEKISSIYFQQKRSKTSIHGKVARKMYKPSMKAAILCKLSQEENSNLHASQGSVSSKMKEPKDPQKKASSKRKKTQGQPKVYSKYFSQPTASNQKFEATTKKSQYGARLVNASYKKSSNNSKEEAIAICEKPPAKKLVDLVKLHSQQSQGQQSDGKCGHYQFHSQGGINVTKKYAWMEMKDRHSGEVISRQKKQQDASRQHPQDSGFCEMEEESLMDADAIIKTDLTEGESVVEKIEAVYKKKIIRDFRTGASATAQSQKNSWVGLTAAEEPEDEHTLAESCKPSSDLFKSGEKPPVGTEAEVSDQRSGGLDNSFNKCSTLADLLKEMSDDWDTNSDVEENGEVSANHSAKNTSLRGCSSLKESRSHVLVDLPHADHLEKTAKDETPDYQYEEVKHSTDGRNPSAGELEIFSSYDKEKREKDFEKLLEEWSRLSEEQDLYPEQLSNDEEAVGLADDRGSCMDEVAMPSRSLSQMEKGTDKTVNNSSVDFRVSSPENKEKKDKDFENLLEEWRRLSGEQNSEVSISGDDDSEEEGLTISKGNHLEEVSVSSSSHPDQRREVNGRSTNTSCERYLGLHTSSRNVQNCKAQLDQGPCNNLQTVRNVSIAGLNASTVETSMGAISQPKPTNPRDPRSARNLIRIVSPRSEVTEHGAFRQLESSAVESEAVVDHSSKLSVLNEDKAQGMSELQQIDNTDSKRVVDHTCVTWAEGEKVKHRPFQKSKDGKKKSAKSKDIFNMVTGKSGENKAERIVSYSQGSAGSNDEVHRNNRSIISQSGSRVRAVPASVSVPSRDGQATCKQKAHAEQGGIDEMDDKIDSISSQNGNRKSAVVMDVNNPAMDCVSECTSTRKTSWSDEQNIDWPALGGENETDMKDHIPSQDDNSKCPMAVDAVSSTTRKNCCTQDQAGVDKNNDEQNGKDEMHNGDIIGGNFSPPSVIGQLQDILAEVVRPVINLKEDVASKRNLAEKIPALQLKPGVNDNGSSQDTTKPKTLQEITTTSKDGFDLCLQENDERPVHRRDIKEVLHFECGMSKLKGGHLQETDPSSDTLDGNSGESDDPVNTLPETADQVVDHQEEILVSESSEDEMSKLGWELMQETTPSGSRERDDQGKDSISKSFEEVIKFEDRRLKSAYIGNYLEETNAPIDAQKPFDTVSETAKCDDDVISKIASETMKDLDDEILQFGESNSQEIQASSDTRKNACEKTGEIGCAMPEVSVPGQDVTSLIKGVSESEDNILTLKGSYLEERESSYKSQIPQGINEVVKELHPTSKLAHQLSNGSGVQESISDNQVLMSDGCHTQQTEVSFPETTKENIEPSTDNIDKSREGCSHKIESLSQDISLEKMLKEDSHVTPNQEYGSKLQKTELEDEENEHQDIYSQETLASTDSGEDPEESCITEESCIISGIKEVTSSEDLTSKSKESSSPILEASRRFEHEASKSEGYFSQKSDVSCDSQNFVSQTSQDKSSAKSYASQGSTTISDGESKCHVKGVAPVAKESVCDRAKSDGCYSQETEMSLGSQDVTSLTSPDQFHINEESQRSEGFTSVPANIFEGFAQNQEHRILEHQTVRSEDGCSQETNMSYGSQDILSQEQNCEQSHGLEGSTTSPSKKRKQHIKTEDPEFISAFFKHSRYHHMSTWREEHKFFVNGLQETDDKKLTGKQKLHVLMNTPEKEQWPEDIVATTPSMCASKKGCENKYRNVVGQKTVIMHIDMDAFFVAVSLLNFPELRGKPLAVTHTYVKKSPKEGSWLEDFEKTYLEKKMWTCPAVTAVQDVPEGMDGSPGIVENKKGKPEEEQLQPEVQSRMYRPERVIIENKPVEINEHDEEEMCKYVPKKWENRFGHDCSRPFFGDKEGHCNSVELEDTTTTDDKSDDENLVSDGNDDKNNRFMHTSDDLVSPQRQDGDNMVAATGEENLVSSVGSSQIKTSVPYGSRSHENQIIDLTQDTEEELPCKQDRFAGLSRGNNQILTTQFNKAPSGDARLHQLTECTKASPGKTSFDMVVTVGSCYNPAAEIASCSYEARDFGVEKGMMLMRARELCPHLRTVPYDFENYHRVSRILYETVASFTNEIEAVSCDEMFIDITRTLQDTGASPREFAQLVLDEIFTKTQCTASAGIASNTLLARLSTRRAKPNGIYVLSDDKVEEFMKDIPVRELPKVGEATSEKLKGLGITTCSELQELSLAALQAQFGQRHGHNLYHQSRGKNDQPIRVESHQKLVSSTVNYGIRFSGNDQAIKFIMELAEVVHKKLKKCGMAGRTISLKLKIRKRNTPEDAKFLGHGSCDNRTKTTTFKEVTDDLTTVQRECRNLLLQMKANPRDIRGVGIHITRLKKASQALNQSKSLKDMLVKKCDKPSPKSPPHEMAHPAGNEVSSQIRGSEGGNQPKIQARSSQDGIRKRSGHKGILHKSRSLDDMFPIKSDMGKQSPMSPSSQTASNSQDNPLSTQGEEQVPSQAKSLEDVAGGELDDCSQRIEAEESDGASERDSLAERMDDDTIVEEVNDGVVSAKEAKTGWSESKESDSPSLMSTQQDPTNPIFRPVTMFGPNSIFSINKYHCMGGPSPGAKFDVHLGPSMLGELPPEVTRKIIEQERSKFIQQGILVDQLGDVEDLPSFSHIDPTCMDALPEEIQGELMSAYRRKSAQGSVQTPKKRKIPEKQPTPVKQKRKKKKSCDAKPANQKSSVQRSLFDVMNIQSTPRQESDAENGRGKTGGNLRRKTL